MLSPNLSVLRSAIGPMLTETCILERNTGRSEPDPETGYEEPVFETVYTGPVLVRPEADSVRIARIAGGLALTVPRFAVTFPAGTPAERTHRLTVTACPGDAELVGAVLTLTEVPLDGWQVARSAVAERQ